MDGSVRTNPASLVRADASLSLRSATRLRGEEKLSSALAAFEVDVGGRVALDLGAAAGGFTRALLNAGARRVYAVDAGHGQLRGSLSRDERVVDLERTNLGDLSPALVPEEVEIVTADLSYVSLAAAIPQLEPLLAIARTADLVALVKPQFELGLPEPPATGVEAAFVAAARGVERAPWRVVAGMRSPVPGARGALEFFLRARRRR